MIGFHLGGKTCSVDHALMLAPGLSSGPPLPSTALAVVLGLSQELGGRVLVQIFLLTRMESGWPDVQGPLYWSSSLHGFLPIVADS